MNDLIIFCGLLALAFVQVGRAWKANREYYELKREIENDRR